MLPGSSCSSPSSASRPDHRLRLVAAIGAGVVLGSGWYVSDLVPDGHDRRRPRGLLGQAATFGWKTPRAPRHGPRRRDRRVGRDRRVHLGLRRRRGRNRSGAARAGRTDCVPRPRRGDASPCGVGHVAAPRMAPAWARWDLVREPGTAAESLPGLGAPDGGERVPEAGHGPIAVFTSAAMIVVAVVAVRGIAFTRCGCARRYARGRARRGRGVSLDYDLSRGRFLIGAIVAGCATWGLMMRVRWLAGAVACDQRRHARLVLVNAMAKPSGLQAGTYAFSPAIWRLERSQAQTLLRPCRPTRARPASSSSSRQPCRRATRSRSRSAPTTSSSPYFNPGSRGGWSSSTRARGRAPGCGTPYRCPPEAQTRLPGRVAGSRISSGNGASGSAARRIGARAHPRSDGQARGSPSANGVAVAGSLRPNPKSECARRGSAQLPRDPRRARRRRDPRP